MIFAAGTALALTLGQAEAQSINNKFNGVWKVALITDTGICDAAYQYGIAIENGSINYRPGTDGAAVDLFGRVDHGGRVQVTLVKGTARAAATGLLRLTSGSGTWKLPTLGCAGRWSAARL